jgi:L-lactate dehydrogenase (cytochrome)
MPVHSLGVLDTLPRSARIGPIDLATAPRTVNEPTAEEKRIAKARAALPHPRTVLNLSQIEVRTFSAPLKASRMTQYMQELAKSVLSKRAWAYYRAGGDDEIS